MSLEGSDNLSSTWEPQLLVEFSGIVKGKYMMGLFGEEFFRFSEKSKMGITKKNVFEIGIDVWLSLNQFGTWGFLFLSLLAEFLWDFRDEEGGGKLSEVGSELRES